MRLRVAMKVLDRFGHRTNTYLSALRRVARTGRFKCSAAGKYEDPPVVCIVENGHHGHFWRYP